MGDTNDKVSISVELKGAEQAQQKVAALNQELDKSKGSGGAGKPGDKPPNPDTESHGGHSARGMRALSQILRRINPELGEAVHGLHLMEAGLKGVAVIGSALKEVLVALVSGPMLALAAGAVAVGAVISALASEFEYAKEKIQHLIEWTDKLIEKNRELAESGKKTSASVSQQLREVGLSPKLQGEIETAAEQASVRANVSQEAARKMAIAQRKELGRTDAKDLAELLAVQASPTTTGFTAEQLKAMTSKMTAVGMSESESLRMFATPAARAKAMALAGETGETAAGTVSREDAAKSAEQQFQTSERGRHLQFLIEQYQLELQGKNEKLANEHWYDYLDYRAIQENGGISGIFASRWLTPEAERGGRRATTAAIRNLTATQAADKHTFVNSTVHMAPDQRRSNVAMEHTPH